MISASQYSYDACMAFGSNTNPNKANYFKATLILFAIVMVIYLVLAVVFFGSVAANQYQ